jgi:transcriptional regulator with XRE-family HTH domain
LNEFGDFLRKLRGKMPYREASERSGVSHAYIRYLEIGKRPGTNTPIQPSPEMLRGLAKAYNYPYKELMKKAGYTDEEETDDMNSKTSTMESDSTYLLKRLADKYNIDVNDEKNVELLERLIQAAFPPTKDS